MHTFKKYLIRAIDILKDERTVLITSMLTLILTYISLRNEAHPATIKEALILNWSTCICALLYLPVHTKGFIRSISCLPNIYLMALFSVFIFIATRSHPLQEGGLIYIIPIIYPPIIIAISLFIGVWTKAIQNLLKKK